MLIFFLYIFLMVFFCWILEDGTFQSNPPPNAFLVPHGLTLAEEHDYLFVADRENGRIECFFASNGSFHQVYQNSLFGRQIYSVAYARDRLYVVNGQVFSENTRPHTRGFVLDVHTGNVLAQFAPRNDMDNPHDIAVTEDGSEIYVVELNSARVYRFVQGKPT